MNEILKFPWGKLFSNLVWILGAAIILAAFSYHEFLAHLQKIRRTEAFKRNSFKKPFLLGLIMVASGINVSIQQSWLTVIIVVVAILLLSWFIKFIKIQAAEKKETKD